MRVRVLTLSLALVISGSAVGCKSAPKLPWFSSADTAKAGAAASTTASGAPTLPSEIAKQTEALAAGADPVKISTAPTASTTGGAAPAYTATTTPGAYPSTGAQDYLSNSAAALKSAASSTVASAATAAKSSLPYDPTAVPPSTATANTTADAPAASADRYGLPSQDRYANAYPTTAPAYTPGSFPTSTAPSAADPATSTPPSVPYASSPTSAPVGDRYATQSTPTTSPATTSVPSYATPTVQPASALASVQPYRPGGTSSYPGTSANYEVATRPGSTSTSTATSGTLYR